MRQLRANKTLHGVKYRFTDVMSSAAKSSRRETKLDRTRRRILDKAAALLRKYGPASVTMADVARAAGLSRQAVYLHFESRTKLMVALLRHIGEQSDGERLFAPVRNASTPQEGLKALVFAMARLNARIHEVALALDLARHADGDARAAWQDRMELRHKGIRRLVKALADRGELVPGWSVNRATHAIEVICLPRLYVDLVVERGFTPRDYERWLSMAIRAFIKAA